MQLFVIYLLICGVGFPVLLGREIYNKKKSKKNEVTENER